MRLAAMSTGYCILKPDVYNSVRVTLQVIIKLGPVRNVNIYDPEKSSNKPQALGH